MRKNLSIILICLLLFLVGTVNLQSQVITVDDTLYALGYKKLEELFIRNSKKKSHRELCEIYGSAYVNLAKKQKDTIKIAKGYDLLYRLYPYDKKSLKLSDSIIDLTQNLKDSIYPARGYLLRGAYYYRHLEYQKALENYLTTLEFTKRYPNIFLEHKIKHSIGLLKNEIGQEKEALDYFEAYFNFIKNHKETKPTLYRYAHFALMDSYNRNKKYDMSLKMAEEGMQHSDLREFYILSAGVSHFYKKNYDLSIEYFQNVIEKLEKTKNHNRLIAYLYTGKAYDSLGNKNKAFNQFKKIDSLLGQGYTSSLKIRESYEWMIDYFKNKKDSEKQLYYIEKLISLDSIFSHNNKNVSNTIIRKYETPILVAQKQEIITELESKKNKYLIYLICSIGLLLIISFFLYRSYKKRKLLIQKFEKIIKENPRNSSKSPQVLKNNKPKDLGIQEEVINTLLKKLEKMENTEGYLERQLTAQSLAKKFNTNVKYLSKIVNHYKEKNFIQYINDLRIDYVINRLKSDNKFRKYTVKAIAHDIGFTNAEAFSKAFHKKTELYPSFFIKQLEKKQKN